MTVTIKHTLFPKVSLQECIDKPLPFTGKIRLNEAFILEIKYEHNTSNTHRKTSSQEAHGKTKA